MSVRIQGAEHPLKEIFSDDFVFEIPPYQRPYSWTPEQAGELLEDVLTAMRDEAGEEKDPYFLGSIVLAKAENDPPSKVIDGQQRLTTLTILLSALAFHAEPEEKEELYDFILQKGSKLKQTQTVFRVTLRPRDAQFFRDHVQEPDGVSELLGLDPGGLSDPEANIQANTRLFVEELRDQTPAERSALAQYLLNDCFLVAVSTPDTESAFKIFTVLNDRGLDLSHADIIKSDLIGSIPDGEQDHFTTVWETAEEDLGIEAFADLFAHIRMIYAKAKARETLVKEFKTHVPPKINDPRVFIEKVMAPYSEVYARILAQSWRSAEHAADINWVLGWLERIDNADWIPPAISYLNMHKQRSDRIFTFLRKLERLAASMFIRRVNINGRIDRYSTLLREIEDSRLFSDGTSVLELTEEEKRETVRQLEGEVYLVRRTRGYILLRLDEGLSDGGASYDHQFITVEHVLPQKPRRDSEWVAWFDDAEREFWVHRLANLLLLPRRRNSAARNYEFDQKKMKYFSSEDGVSPFVLTTQVLQAQKWTPDVLRARQDRLVSKLVDMWGLAPSADEGRDRLTSFSSS